MNQRKAIQGINKRGILLVFPVNNAKEPLSLWSEFYPRSKMRWEWDEDGDDRVGRLWLLMKKLSDGREVVYSKWYRGRATFFSRELFTAMLCLLRLEGDLETGLPRASRDLLDVLENDSPLSTRDLKKWTGLRGRDNEPEYNRGMKELFSRFLVVAYGEVEDGAFPSLAVGSTKHLYEDLWVQSKGLDPKEALKIVDRNMPIGSAFRKFFDKVLSEHKKRILEISED